MTSHQEKWDAWRKSISDAQKRRWAKKKAQSTDIQKETTIDNVPFQNKEEALNAVRASLPCAGDKGEEK